MAIIASGSGIDVSSAANISFESGKRYEHRIEVRGFPEIAKIFTDISNTLFNHGAELINSRTERNQIIYTFKRASVSQAVPQLAIPFIGVVIGAVMLTIAFLVIRWTLSEVIIPAGFDVLKLLLIGFGGILIIAGAAIVLKRVGIRPGAVAEPVLGAGKFAAREAERGGRIIEEVITRKIRR